MRPVDPERRPPLAAWGLGLLAIMPMIWAFAANRNGWPYRAHEAAAMWSMALLGLSAGLIIAATILNGHWRGAYAAILVPMLVNLLVWLQHLNFVNGILLGLALIFLLDLWAAGAGFLPRWWPRLKLAISVLYAALLLGFGLR